MDITGKTKITGLFGYPVEHSLSPAMHNAAFEHLGLDFCYLPFLVHPDLLARAVDSLHALNLSGVNVTVPHKERVIAYLDTLNEEALFMGAVNTIVHADGILTGYNTDGKGFMRALSEHAVSADKKRILIIGSGGASRAISYYLSEHAELLHLFDTDRNKQEKLVSDLSNLRTGVSGIVQIKDINQYNIIINATPLGLRKEDPLPLDVSALSPSQTVCDLIYRTTPLLEQARQKGCRTIDGSGMLLWQGVLAFELWTGVAPPVDIMRNALLKRIK